MDSKLKRFFSLLPCSFDILVREIEVHGQSKGNVRSYVGYLLDDSKVPLTVCDTFKPDFLKSPINWYDFARHQKTLFFSKGLLDSAKTPSLLDDYQETYFTRFKDLTEAQDHNPILRLQLKDSIIKEIVRAYLEGQAAGTDVRARLSTFNGNTVLVDALTQEYKQKGCINARVLKKLTPTDGAGPMITFFMIVTDRDILIADYCIKSFCLLRDLDFRLKIYCNWITYQNRVEFIEKWRLAYPFVEIVEPKGMRENKPPEASLYGYGVQGPYERPEVPWDKELPKLKSKYYATIDADFEILRPEFVYSMIEELEKSDTLGWVGTDKTAICYYSDPNLPGKNILHDRIDTWCVVYRAETAVCKVSHLYYHEDSPAEDIIYDIWDCAALKQLALRSVYGWEDKSISPKWQHMFIHYRAFSKNRYIDKTNIEMYRQLMIMKKINLENLIDSRIYYEYKTRLQAILQRAGIKYPDTDNVSQLATKVYSHLFSHVDNANPYKN